MFAELRCSRTTLTAPALLLLFACSGRSPEAPPAADEAGEGEGEGEEGEGEGEEGEGEGEGEGDENPDFGVVAEEDLVSLGVLTPAETVAQRAALFGAFSPAAPLSADAPDASAAALREDLRATLRQGALGDAWWDHDPGAPHVVHGATQADYDVKVLHIEALPDTWVPATLYVPHGALDAPAVLALNGHGDTVTTVDVQRRAIQLAKRGFVVLQPEWFQRGQLGGAGMGHTRLNQLELCGVRPTRSSSPRSSTSSMCSRSSPRSIPRASARWASPAAAGKRCGSAPSTRASPG